VLALHPEARDEYHAALAWYEARRPAVAAAFDQAVMDALDAIAANPRAWPPVPGRRAAKLGVRRFVLRDFPYTIIFDIQEELISVVAIAHMRRRPGYWLKRVESK
jgi:toxin ParE1/3/4